MKTILIFEPQSGGHRANFFQWLEKAVEADVYSDCRFVFFAAKDISASVSQRLAAAGWWQKQRLLYQIFRQACQRHAPDHVLVLELTHLELPLALFGSPVPLSAILFVQYPELSKGWKKVSKHWKTRLLLWRAPLKNLFLLNGERSCQFLTKKFTLKCLARQNRNRDLNAKSQRARSPAKLCETLSPLRLCVEKTAPVKSAHTRFIPIPDPAPDISAEENCNLREHVSVSKDRKIFLFFGAISKRKGADVLLDALRQISPEVAKQSTFIFCGEPEVLYKNEFEKFVAEVQDLGAVELRVENSFVSNERMMALFEQSDVILMPYTRPEYSSGILSIAAKAGTPVLGPTDGLLGRLIRENGLGATTQTTPAALAEALALPICAEVTKQRAFAEKASPIHFAKTILDSICNES